MSPDRAGAERLAGWRRYREQRALQRAFGFTTPQVGSGSFDGSTTNLGLAAGLILSTGEVDNAVGPASEFSGDDNDTGSDPDLVTISGGTDQRPCGAGVRFRADGRFAQVPLRLRFGGISRMDLFLQRCRSASS